MLILILPLCIGGTATVEPAEGVGTRSCPQIEVYFSPNGGCTDAIVSQIDSAAKSVHVQAYLFETDRIANALVAAKERGVTVIAVLDRWNEQDKYSAADTLNNAAIATYIDDDHETAHDKIIIIDDQTLITGSFNFTVAAEEKNAENLLIIRDAPDLVRKYQENFEKHKSHSYGYAHDTAAGSQ
jgi:phosphatidylserine/phosphatidylglycerophosphate/cardiolipin synthase-like enzyme